jgi:flagellar protein FlaG
MNISVTQLAGTAPSKTEVPVEKVERTPKPLLVKKLSLAEEEEGGAKKVQAEEILSRIKALTEDGSFSVRFEMHARTNQLVVRLVDAESGELIRQLPPEEMLELAARLEELSGNIVNAKS